ncbi:cobalamin synthase : Adenosylcobinamide-GDP ribazoletransferase OS=Isosphaera pallida (strain ATCC 43644 / DSM 9630 / IS1B) GN=cobS PE=3 SV=1: CobS [Gemmataceae bacterium]|nr:cobalamin synthase : Adenosylcobinamide-GDP ribazoletransferase OS=Isosphaera pallida (strain ATCC 43644 / DSM 9630 / IS1B) GN=cobS PE=3 SV=1: CobS [Gemmataceae bacterium]VTU02494.1 cobalamin synthase : Adenosylcobinamide-GDP ribazoletransferase OS=Isosphaera pallida (strain ATCC 43644 / DSM 9630 / IS1B) GN=cobS PE=3 SV=1: CobS [Gemmataceae bacterium]
MSLSRQFQAAITAVQFLTRVPLPGGMNRSHSDRTLLRAAVVYFPLVGGLIGAFTGGVVWAALLVWTPVVAVALGLLAEALLTGAFHEDAVADCCDAFGGGWTRDDVLRIMKDSRVGSFGALGLTLAVLLRGGCLLTIPAEEVAATAAASAAVGRWGILVLMASAAPVTNREGLAKDVGERIGWRELGFGSVLAVPAVFAFAWVSPLRAAVGLVAVVVSTLAWAGYVRRRIGGVTGDCLGCGCYLGQCVFLLAATAGGGR